jgi:transcriptional regulator with XRE-family HTH domain
LTPRTSLKVAFVVAGVSQRAVSMTTDIPKTRLSSIVRGRTEPHPRERAALSAALGRDERDPREKDRSAAIEEVSGRSRRHDCCRRSTPPAVGEPIEPRTYPNDEALWGRTSSKRFQLNYTGDEPIEGDRTTEPIPPSSVVDVRGEPERSDQ